MLSVAAISVASGVTADEPRNAPQSPDFQSAVARARASVFKVECVDPADPKSALLLSAVAIDHNGELVTVGMRSPGDRKLYVRNLDGKRYEARWVAADEQTGLALLKTAAAPDASPPATASRPRLGAAVIVVGNPFGLSHSVSVGNISGLDRSVTIGGTTTRGLIQFTAPVFPGDSGGLLADADGHMLGVVCTALSEPNVSEFLGERRLSGIGFAIPVNDLREITERLRGGLKIERGYLGVSGDDAEDGGVRVTRIADDSPAQAAGLRVGDVLRSMDDAVVRDFDDLATRVERLKPGTEITLRVVREEEELTANAIVAERKSPAATAPVTGKAHLGERRLNAPDPRWRGSLDIDLWNRAWPRPVDGDAGLGVQTLAVTERSRKSLGLTNSDGALVSSVVEGSSADRAGLRPSDLIITLNAVPVRSPKELDERIREAAPASPIKIGIIRGGKNETLAIYVAGEAQSLGGDLRILRLAPGRMIEPAGSRSISAELEERVRALETKIEDLESRLRERSKSPERED